MNVFVAGDRAGPSDRHGNNMLGSAVAGERGRRLALGGAVAVLAITAVTLPLARGFGSLSTLLSTTHRAPLAGMASQQPSAQVPTAARPAPSRTRDARVRQLALERQEGDYLSPREGEDGLGVSGVVQERGDGEDEQQGGIEQVQFGSGWGPEMDRALGNIPVDEDAMDAHPQRRPGAASAKGAERASSEDAEIKDLRKRIAKTEKDMVAKIGEQVASAEKQVTALKALPHPLNLLLTRAANGAHTQAAAQPRCGRALRALNHTHTYTQLFTINTEADDAEKEAMVRGKPQ